MGPVTEPERKLAGPKSWPVSKKALQEKIPSGLDGRTRQFGVGGRVVGTVVGTVVGLVVGLVVGTVVGLLVVVPGVVVAIVVGLVVVGGGVDGQTVLYVILNPLRKMP